MSDDSTSVDSAAVVHELFVQLLADRERGQERSPAEYQALFPGHEERVARELEELETEAPGDAEPSAAQHGAESFGRYSVLRELGRGGQGVVYLAEDPELHRMVALKVLAGAVGLSPDSLLRFRREAEAASRLDHPGICTVYEAGEVAGVPYIAMRYVRGRTLRDELVAARETRRAGGTPTGSETRAHVMAVVQLVEEVARALHHAHEQGLVHRDIKPANILVADEGGPVVLDFGLVRDQTGDADGLTSSGDLLGTPAYLSPEQLRASPAAIDRRTDVYSLGATLYECLALRRPFEAPTREALYRQILTEAPTDVGRLNRHVPVELKVVLDTALEKDRGRRYQTALDLAEDLRRVRERQPIRARPPGPGLRAHRWVQRNPAPAVAMVLLAVGLVVAGLLLRQRNEALDRLQGVALADASKEVQEKNGQLALLLARKAIEVDRAPYTISQLHAALATAHERALLAGHGAQVMGVAFPPDGSFVLTWSVDGSARRWSLSGELLRTYEHPPGDGHAAPYDENGNGLWDGALSPGGDRVLTASHDGRAILWALDGSRIAELSHDGPVLSATFSRDGERILTTSTDFTAKLWAAEGQPIRTLHGHESSVLCGAFSEEGNRVVTGSSDRSAQVWERVDGSGWELVALLGGEDGHKGQIWGATFSPDGERVLTFSSNGGRGGLSREDHTARLWDVSSEECLQVFEHDDMLWSAEFSPDGEGVLTASADGTVRLWWLGEQGALADVAPVVVDRIRNLQSACFSPSGERILVTGSSGYAMIHELPGVPIVAFNGHSSWVYAGAFSPDGELVATGANEGAVRLWEVSPPALPLLTARGGAITWVATSRNWIAAVSRSGWLRVWDHRGELQWERLHPEPGERLWHVTFSPREERVIATPTSGDLVVWSIAGERLMELETPERVIRMSAEFSPRRDGLLLTTQGSLDLCDPSGEPLVPFEDEDLPGGTLKSAVFSPAGDRVLSASWNRTATIWGPSGQVLDVLEHEAFVNRAAFSPDGALILTACEDSRAYLWDPERGPRNAQGRLQPTQVFAGHEKRVTTAAFSPDGELVVTASADGTARLWTLDGVVVEVYRAHRGTVTNAVFTPDGDRVLTSSVDGTVRTWVVDTDELIRLVDQRLAGRRLTRAQEERFADLLDR